MPLELFKKSEAAKERKKHKKNLEFREKVKKGGKKAEKAMKKAMGMFGKGKRKLIF